jgi:glutathione S-transferase
MRLFDYSASANCYKPRLLLALLDREYERVPVDIFAGDTLADAYAALNPARETPVLELDDGTIITQSNAILWFLAEGTPLISDSALERSQVVQWLCFEQERVVSRIGACPLLDHHGPLSRPRVRTARSRRERSHHARSPPRWAQLPRRRRLLDRRRGELRLHPCRRRRRPQAGRLSVRQRLADRVRALPGFIDDLAPYPDNARPHASHSIYDE